MNFETAGSIETEEPNGNTSPSRGNSNIASFRKDNYKKNLKTINQSSINLPVVNSRLNVNKGKGNAGSTLEVSIFLIFAKYTLSGPICNL